MSPRRRRTALGRIKHRPARRTVELVVHVYRDGDGHWTWLCTCGATGRCHRDHGHALNEAGLHRSKAHWGERVPVHDAEGGPEVPGPS